MVSDEWCQDQQHSPAGQNTIGSNGGVSEVWVFSSRNVSENNTIEAIRKVTNSRIIELFIRNRSGGDILPGNLDRKTLQEVGWQAR